MWKISIQILTSFSCFVSEDGTCESNVYYYIGINAVVDNTHGKIQSTNVTYLTSGSSFRDIP
jgi:hypothetical protein